MLSDRTSSTANIKADSLTHICQNTTKIKGSVARSLDRQSGGLKAWLTTSVSLCGTEPHNLWKTCKPEPDSVPRNNLKEIAPLCREQWFQNRKIN